ICIRIRAIFLPSFKIAREEADETGSWLELLYKTGYIEEEGYKALDSTRVSIRVMLIASIKTARGNI
ncbi:MAG: four helix bundle protein, partial [Candidatus Heritagella sp.]